MNFTNELRQESVAEKRSADVTQGFIEQLEKQLVLATEDAKLVSRLRKAGKKDQMNKVLRMLGGELFEAAFAYQSLIAATSKDSKND